MELSVVELFTEVDTEFCRSRDKEDDTPSMNEEPESCFSESWVLPRFHCGNILN